MRWVIYWTLSCALFFCMAAVAEDSAKTDSSKELSEAFVTTQHSVKIDGKQIKYTATAGNLVLRDADGKQKASIFFIAYNKEGTKSNAERPITFVTNGGPGSSAIWLHLGMLGPRRVELDEFGMAIAPYHLIDNENSLLGASDLVFIDPVSSGYSRAAPGEDPKQFHGVEEDIQALSEFIRLYLSRFKRWESPKFFAGESYGTTRAAALAERLYDSEHIYLNGVVLISTVLNFQTIDFDKGNDYPYILYLPSYASTAWYHRRLADDLQSKSLAELLPEVERFAIGEYASALMQGDQLEKEQRDAIIVRVARYTGLSKEYIDRVHLRVSLPRFVKELLRDQNRTIGRFDGRYEGIESEQVCERYQHDPSADAVFGAFTACFNHYVSTELGWITDTKYEVLADVWPWNYGRATNAYLNVSEDLRDVMFRNPKLKVFVANGYFDLATPYFATVYTFNHMGLDPSLKANVTMRDYYGGHMMYNHRPSLVDLNSDISHFIQQAAK